MKVNFLYFVKKNALLLGIVILVIILFSAYNAFLIDHSVVNLKYALEQLANAKTTEDFEKIKPLLKIVLLNEISKKSVSDKNVIALELAENIVSNAKNIKQAEDVKFYLRSVIAEKEQQRGDVLNTIDRLNSAFNKPDAGPSQNRLEAQANNLLTKINSVSDPDTKQQLLNQLSSIYLKLERYPEVVKTLSRLITIDPKATISLEAKFNIAWAYKKMNDYKNALKYFEEVIKEFADKKIGIMSHYEIADTHAKEGTYTEARDRYAWLAEKYPKFDMADLALYEAGYISFYYLNDRQAALKFFSELEKKYPDANIVQHEMRKIRPIMAAGYRKQGFDSLKESNFTGAIDSFGEAVKIAPYDARSWSGMGLGLHWMKKDDEAIEKVATAMSKTLEDEVAVANTLYVYVNADRYDEAIAIGEKALSYAPRTTGEFYYNLGCAYYFKKDYKRALSHFRKAAQLKPRSAAIENNIGCTLWADQRFNEAIDSFNDAARADPSYATAYFNLGVSYLSINNLEAARNAFKKTLELDPSNNKARRHLKNIEKSLNY